MSAHLSTLAQELDAATRMMQAGQFVQARRRLEQIVMKDPSVAQAHWLLGGALLHTGDPVAAERAVRTAIKLAPGSVASHALLGEILAAQGHPMEAEAALRRALAVDRRHASAAANLAKLLLDQQRASDALQLIDEFIRAAGSTPSLLLLRAHALLSLGDQTRAIPAFRQALAGAPDNVSAHMGLAVALADSGRFTEAEAGIRHAITRGYNGAQSRFLLARTLAGQRRFEEAESEFRNAIRLRPDYVEAHINLAETLWMRTGDAQAVVSEIDSSLEIVPALIPLRILKAKLLEASGASETALAELESALAHSDDHFALRIAASQVAVKFDASRALAHSERACKLKPADALALGTYGNALLAAGQAKKAEALVGQMLAANPEDGLAIALQATAWRMVGDPRYRTSYDYGQFVRPERIDTPTGWPNLSVYLDQLARALAKLHTLRMHPIGQSLRGGTQADLRLEHSEDPAIRAFAQAIDGPVRRYLQAIGRGDDPLRRRNTGKYELGGIWSVRLRPHGYHFNHFHPEGWLSSACYIDIPHSLGDHNGEGWLQFGEPAFPTMPPTPPEYFVRPEPGLLVLFPSWFWHGTIPFSGGPDDCRLTIAFDIIPA